MRARISSIFESHRRRTFTMQTYAFYFNTMIRKVLPNFRLNSAKTVSKSVQSSPPIALHTDNQRIFSARGDSSFANPDEYIRRAGGRWGGSHCKSRISTSALPSPRNQRRLEFGGGRRFSRKCWWRWCRMVTKLFAMVAVDGHFGSGHSVPRSPSGHSRKARLVIAQKTNERFGRSRQLQARWLIYYILHCFMQFCWVQSVTSKFENTSHFWCKSED